MTSVPLKNDIYNNIKGLCISVSASTTSAITVYPIDLVKTRIQSQRTAKYKNSWVCFVHIVKYEGILRLYNGLFPYLVGQGIYSFLLSTLVPEKALRLTIVENVRSAVKKHTNAEANYILDRTLS